MKTDGNLLATLWQKRDEALDRVIDLWLNDDLDDEALNRALDVLTVAHATASFEQADGSFSEGLLPRDKS